jgi:transketolase
MSGVLARPTGERVATRYAFADAILELGAEDPRIVVLDADVSKSLTTDRFGAKFPGRGFNIGVAEQNMMCTAAGLSTVGLIPFACTYGVFASMRSLEQIRTTICYPRLNVKVVGSHGGITAGPDGASHQAIEDLALMRSLANMTVLMPADAPTMRLAVRAAARWDGPVYIRLTRDPVPVLFDASYPFEIGRAVTLRDGGDAAILAIGDMVAQALGAAEALAKEGVSVRVLDMHTVKPLDEEVVLKAAEETGAIVTAEDHTILGGLGGAVSEVLAERRPTPLQRIGIRDCFTESGAYADLLAKFGLTSSDIAAAVRKAVARKRGVLQSPVPGPPL